jgi:hypothetical protein
VGAIAVGITGGLDCGSFVILASEDKLGKVSEGAVMIQIAIEGPDAVAATEALLALPEVSGAFEVLGEVSGEVEKEGVLATIATIVGIVGGGMAAAEQIRKWHGEYRGNPEQLRIEKVLIVTPRGRILLENATTSEIAQALEPFTTSSDAATARFAPPRSDSPRSIDADGGS